VIINEILEKEINDLLKLGTEIQANALSLRTTMKGQALTNVSSWVTRLGQLIRRLYGKESQQFHMYSECLKAKGFWNIHSNWNAHISQMNGIITSIKHDFDNGLLNNLRALIQADIFADFLEMGEYLLSEGYKDAAAVIIGAVLEDSLRKICEKNGIKTNNKVGKPLTIDPLNIALAKADIYNKLTQKQITTFAHIRNKAAHGEFQEYDKAQVDMMLLFVRNFAAEYLN
jgi:hypothetical protein